MSNFICEKCGTIIVDTPRGYTTGCEHYPDYRPCPYNTCNWMCGKLFIETGLERECNWDKYEGCVMR